MVDYSKWDKLDISDDEETGSKRPRVQAFDVPQTVTIGGGGVQIQPSGAESGRERAQGGSAAEAVEDDEPMEPPSDEDLQPGEDLREDVLQLRALAERALSRGDPAEAVRLLEKAVRFGGAGCPGLEDVLAVARRQAQAATPVEQPPRPAPDGAKAANGGLVEGRYRWSQTRETVQVNIFVPEGTKAKAISKVAITETDVRVDVDGSPVLRGDWEFKVEPEEDPDWELLDGDGRRALRLTVRKKAMPGGLSVVVWWRRVLKGDPAIDIENIDDRKKDRAEVFAKAWQEAHTAFRDKVAQRERIPVDLAGGDGGHSQGMEVS